MNGVKALQMMATDGMDSSKITTENPYQGPIVLVGSRRQAEQFTAGGTEVCISIRCSGDTVPELSRAIKDVLYLEFDDCKQGVDFYGVKKLVEFSDEQADKVVEFFAKHKDTSSQILIHCFAGVSRSRSMAAALVECFGLPFKFTAFNDVVYTKVKKAYSRYISTEK